jgi:AraC-like DNA-binding protein
MTATLEIENTGFSTDLKLKGFKVYPLDLPRTGLTTFGRRHFYKIVLSIGNARVNYANRTIDMNGVYLFFVNPHVPYAVEMLGERQTGYGCTFTESFIKPLERSESLLQSPLFKVSGTPAFRLSEAQQATITGIFERMIAEKLTNYPYKDELIRNYIQLLIHEALRMGPVEHVDQFTSASLRLTTLFLELLERQFPVENHYSPLMLKTAQNYADRLSIHVNYLNRSVKEVTGHSTTAHIARKVTAEAVTMLQHTDWPTAHIAYALGFEYPNYFNKFFKKMTGKVPKAYRSR